MMKLFFLHRNFLALTRKVSPIFKKVTDTYFLHTICLVRIIREESTLLLGFNFGSEDAQGTKFPHHVVENALAPPSQIIHLTPQVK